MVPGADGGGVGAGGHSMIPAIAPVLSASVTTNARVICFSVLMGFS